MNQNTIYCGDSAEILSVWPDECIDCCVTSPPYYGLRDYGIAGQIGLERTPEEYIAKLVKIFRHVRRVMKPTGTLWVNIGDSYAGSGRGAGDTQRNSEKQRSNSGSWVGDSHRPYRGDDIKPKDLIGIPWLLAFALRADGWYLRQDIIWNKLNPMTESVKDRCTKSHEYVFLLSKSPRYYFDSEAIREKAVTSGRIPTNAPRYGGKKYTATPDKFYRTKSGNAYIYREFRNKRDVWTLPTRPLKEAHFATFPEDLIVPCILAGCPENGIVLDPFMGSGTTSLVAKKLRRQFVGCEINPSYVELAKKRIEEILMQQILF